MRLLFYPCDRTEALFVFRGMMEFTLRKKIFDRDSGKCQMCEQEVRLFSKYYGDLKTGEIDHIFPKSLGGNNSEANLQLLCLLCNRRKYNKVDL